MIAYAQIGVNNAAVFEIIKRYVSEFEAQEYCFKMLVAVAAVVTKYINARRAEAQELAQTQRAQAAAGNKKWLH